MFIKSSIAILLFVVASSQANAEITLKTLKTISDVSRIAGVCGTYEEMTHFQAKNPTLAEFNFIARFMDAEAARIGLPSAAALWERCVAKSKEYVEIYNAINK